MNHPAIMKTAHVIIPPNYIAKLGLHDWEDYRKTANDSAPRGAKHFFFVWLDAAQSSVKALYLNSKATAQDLAELAKAGYDVRPVKK